MSHDIFKYFNLIKHVKQAIRLPVSCFSTTGRRVALQPDKKLGAI